MIWRQGHTSSIPGRLPGDATKRPTLGPFLAPSGTLASAPSGSRVLTRVVASPKRIAVRRPLQSTAVVPALPKRAVPAGQAVPVPETKAAPTKGATNGPSAPSTSIIAVAKVVHAGATATTPAKAPESLPVEDTKGAPSPSAAPGATARVDLPIRLGP